MLCYVMLCCIKHLYQCPYMLSFQYDLHVVRLLLFTSLFHWLQRQPDKYALRCDMEGSHAGQPFLLDLMTKTSCQDVRLTQADYELILSCAFQGQASCR